MIRFPQSEGLQWVLSDATHATGISQVPKVHFPASKADLYDEWKESLGMLQVLIPRKGVGFGVPIVGNRTVP